MKTFLMDQVKQGEARLATNMKDISILKDMLKIEKNMNSKNSQTITQRDQEIKDLRAHILEQQQEDKLKINDLELKVD